MENKVFLLQELSDWIISILNNKSTVSTLCITDKCFMYNAQCTLKALQLFYNMLCLTISFSCWFFYKLLWAVESWQSFCEPCWIKHRVLLIVQNVPGLHTFYFSSLSSEQVKLNICITLSCLYLKHLHFPIQLCGAASYSEAVIGAQMLCFYYILVIVWFCLCVHSILWSWEAFPLPAVIFSTINIFFSTHLIPWDLIFR